MRTLSKIIARVIAKAKASLTSARRNHVQRAQHVAHADRDPYYGIKSKGRQGATRRAAAMAAAHAETYIGKRNIRGRDLSWISKKRGRRTAA